MTNLSEKQMRAIRQAAEDAYDDILGAVGDHQEMRNALRTMAIEVYRAGYAEGLWHGRDE